MSVRPSVFWPTFASLLFVKSSQQPREIAITATSLRIFEDCTCSFTSLVIFVNREDESCNFDHLGARNSILTVIARVLDRCGSIRSDGHILSLPA